jgi:predicted metal-dependent HD superfamily phosphohydrolase
MKTKATPQRFTEICCRVGVSLELARKSFDDLTAQYSGKHRSYHNLSHIDRMLSWFDVAANGSDSVELAIWFHDIIYEPRSDQNESDSALYFMDRFSSVIDEWVIDDVKRLIMATDLKCPRSGRSDEDLLIDIDWSILGAEPDTYEAYRSAIRHEYRFVSEVDFTVGRKRILQHFLSRPIYTTPLFSQLEPQARLNIENEIQNL